MFFRRNSGDLTQREAQVAGMVALGMSSKEIALVLSVSVRTVETHLQNIYKKLKLQNRAALAVYAERHGITGTYVN
jgi:two-component system nitrate/nitrite response regulator NarL